MDHTTNDASMTMEHLEHDHLESDDIDEPLLPTPISELNSTLPSVLDVTMFRVLTMNVS